MVEQLSCVDQCNCCRTGYERQRKLKSCKQHEGKLQIDQNVIHFI